MEIGITEIVQTGALGLFVYYTLTNNREWRNYLAERNSKLEMSLDKLSTAIDRIVDKT